MALLRIPATAFFMSVSLFSAPLWAAQPQKSSQLSAWEEVKPGGNTLCARGAEFAFFVNRGTSNKVVIDFIGGGACWDAKTCDVGSSTFSDTVDSMREHERQGLEGIYDKTNPKNPLADWTHVIVPYCTGDIHWGSHDQTYTRTDGSNFVIHHRGAVNAQAVLDWVKTNVPEPERVLSTGCSAGSYGSIYWAPAIKEMFPNAALRQLGDSGAGVITPEFMTTMIEKWNISGMAPTWVPGLDPAQVDWKKLSISDVYNRVAAYYPSTGLAQFNSANDFVQTYFYVLMQGEQEAWPALMRSRINAISGTVPNFNYYISQGGEHCVIPWNYLYETQTRGVPFTDWLRDYANGLPIQNQECDDCGEANKSL